MAAEEEGERYELAGARVFVHVTRHGDERIIHLDVDHEDLGGLIPLRESTYAGGRDGGIYVGLRPNQVSRAEDFLRGRTPAGGR